MHQIRNPDEALEFGPEALFLCTTSRAIPKEESYASNKLPWITSEIGEEIYYRDFLLKSEKRELFIRQKIM